VAREKSETRSVRPAPRDPNPHKAGTVLKDLEPDLGPLQTSLTFHIKRTDALVFQHFNRRIRRDQFVRGEMAILTLVKTNAGVRQDVLGRAVGLDKSTISTAIAKLKRRGLIEQRGTEDGRVRRLYVTPAGRAFLRRMAPLIAMHETEIASGLAPTERDQLMALLERVFSTVVSGR
jgi:DNA-binding MarR family transcriptional regulator